MYKVASDKRQRGLHHGKPADWVNGAEQMSIADQFQQKKDEMNMLIQKMEAAVGTPERKEFGRQKLALQNEMSAFRKLLGKEKLKADGYEQVFIQVAKELLSPVQYRTISQATFRELERRKSEVLTPLSNGDHRA